MGIIDDKLIDKVINILRVSIFEAYTKHNWWFPHIQIATDHKWYQSDDHKLMEQVTWQIRTKRPH